MAFILLLGGARAGKSALAMEIAAQSGGGVTVVATAQPLDGEMADRIGRHRAERPTAWTTIEEPIELAQAIGRAAEADVLIVDCLTLWVANLLERDRDEVAVEAAAVRVATALQARRGSAVVVSNEVGLGIVPLNPSARRYRDILGHVNAHFGAAAERTVLVVAGQVLDLSPAAKFVEGLQWHRR